MSETCPVCDTPAPVRVDYPVDVEPFASAGLLGCTHCGVAWMAKGAIDLDAYYADEYGANFGRKHIKNPERFFRRHETGEEKPRRWKRAMRLASLAQDKRKVLDIGSGPGLILRALDPDKGYAVEPDRHSAACLKHLGVRRINLKRIGWHGPFDTVFSSHSLEHFWLEDLPQVLRKVRDVTRGRFVFEVPYWGLLRHSPEGGKHAPHTVFFTAQSVAMLLEKAGFSKVELIDPPGGTRPLLTDPAWSPSRHEAQDGKKIIYGWAEA